jgi:hypothetical protein
MTLTPRRGSVLLRHGKGGRRREVGMDAWGWENLRPWLSERLELPAGPLFCVIDDPTRGRPWSAAAVRTEFRRHAAEAGVRRRVLAPRANAHCAFLHAGENSIGHATVCDALPAAGPRRIIYLK